MPTAATPFDTPQTPVPNELLLPPAPPVASLLADLLLDYAQRDTGQSFQNWLANTLVQRSGISPEAALETTHSVLGYLDDSHQLRTQLQQHLDCGKSRSSWIATQIERIASDCHASASDVAALSALLSGRISAQTPIPASAMDWNDISRIAIAQNIEQSQRLHSAADLVLSDQAQNWASQVQWLEGHPASANPLLQQFFRGELDLRNTAALQALLAIGVEIAGRRGLLGQETQQGIDSGALLPAWFAQNTFVGMENARVIYAVGNGQLDAHEAIDHITNTATAACLRTAREVCTRLGGQIGAALVSKIPWIGAFLTPAGRRLGQAIGGMVGELAGQQIGKVIRKGVEVVKSTAVGVVSAAKNTIRTVGEKIKSFSALFDF